MITFLSKNNHRATMYKCRLVTSFFAFTNCVLFYLGKKTKFDRNPGLITLPECRADHFIHFMLPMTENSPSWRTRVPGAARCLWTNSASLSGMSCPPTQGFGPTLVLLSNFWQTFGSCWCDTLRWKLFSDIKVVFCNLKTTSWKSITLKRGCQQKKFFCKHGLLHMC